jgi:hypothetical protein
MLAVKGETISAIVKPGKQRSTASNINKSKPLKLISTTFFEGSELRFWHKKNRVEVALDFSWTLNLKYRADLCIKDVDDFSSEFSIGDCIADVVFHVEPHGTNIM